MKILVTGSNGFIGKNLIKSLFKESYEVYRLDLEDFYIFEKWNEKLRDTLNKVNPDVVFHVGACSDTLEQSVNYMMEVNYESTKMITDWCKFNSKKMIYSSSAANYGANGIYPSNLYGWSKYVAEGYVTSNGGLALRYFNVYGPGEYHKDRMSSVALQSHLKFKRGEKIMLFPGYPSRDFIYVKDVVLANLYAMKNYEKLKGEWYDVGSSSSRTFEDVLKCMGIEKWQYTQDSEIPKGYQFNTKALKSMPGWSSKYNLEEGLKEYLKNMK